MSKGVDAYVEALIAIGPPDVSGGPEWYDDYVDAARRQVKNTDFLADQYLDEFESLPATSAPSRAEKALGERGSELLRSIDEETDELERAKPAMLTDYERQCSRVPSNNSSRFSDLSYRNLGD